MDRNRACWYHNVCNYEYCSETCIRYLEMKYLMDNSYIPVKMQLPIKLEQTEINRLAVKRLDEIKQNINEFVQNGNSLFICSSVTGTGKTSSAIKLMLRYFNNIWSGNGFHIRGVFVHVPTLLNNLKNFDNGLSEDYKNSLIQADLVIWDDLASTALSKYDYAQLLVYLDARVLQGKANIFTSNLCNAKELLPLLGERLLSRSFGSSEVINLMGFDYRPHLAKKKQIKKKESVADDTGTGIK